MSDGKRIQAWRDAGREEVHPFRGTRLLFRKRRNVFRKWRKARSGLTERGIYATKRVSWHATHLSEATERVSDARK